MSSVLPARDTPAICYSGYRQGHNPRDGIYPSYEQIREDLLILAPRWKLLRVYDPSAHAERVLEVIANEGLDMRVMLGLELAAELNNPGCPWATPFDDATLGRHRVQNDDEVERAIALANRYPELIFAVSAGNEAAVDWSDHLVSVERIRSFVRRLRDAVDQPLTFCDNYVPWANTLAPLVEELDFLCVHTYPVWEQQTVDHALAYTRQNVASVVDRYPDTPVVVSEAGWTTRSNGRGIEPWNATEALQARYVPELLGWARAEGIITFVFEAFDEPWKGSDDPSEPEKHWGLYFEDRTPKRVVDALGHP